MNGEEAIKYLIKPVATSTEIGEEKQKEFEAYNMAIEALKAGECKCCAYWDKLDYDAPRQGWCNQFEEWTDADEFCSRCARMKGGDT